MRTTKAVTALLLLSLGLALTGCPDPKPSLSRIRFELSVTDAVAKLVTYEKSPDTDTSSKLHGVGESGITTAQGVAIVLTIEPQAAGSPDDLDGSMTVRTLDSNIVRYNTVYSKSTSSSEPNRKVVLIAEGVGKTTLQFSFADHDGTVDVPITVTAQTAP